MARSPVTVRFASLRLSTRRFLTLVAAIAVGAASYGAAVADQPLAGALEALVYAMVIGAPLAFVEVYDAWLPLIAATRRWPFLAMAALKSVAYAIWIVVGAAVAGWITHHPDPAPLSDVLDHREILASAIVAAIGINAFLVVTRLLGPGTLGRVLAGRYHRPRSEERGFAFLDVRGATAIAERIGDERFHRFLGEVFRIVERAAHATGGEIEDYIGDGVLISWPIDRRPGRGPLVFAALATAALARCETRFRERFGCTAAVRIGAHAGGVVAGEIGEVRRKIVLIGDTVNTAARIEQLARELDADVLATGAVLNRFPLPAGFEAEALGAVPLRGKAEPVETYRIRGAAHDGARRMDRRCFPTGRDERPAVLSHNPDGAAGSFDRTRAPPRDRRHRE